MGAPQKTTIQVILFKILMHPLSLGSGISLIRLLHYFIILMLNRNNFDHGTALSKAILEGRPSPLWIAADGGCESLTKVLLEMLDKCPTTDEPQSSPDGTSALEIATAHGHHGIMKLLGQSSLFSMDEVKRLCIKFDDKLFLKENFGYEG